MGGISETEIFFQKLATRLVLLAIDLKKGSITKERHDEEAESIRETWRKTLKSPDGEKWVESYNGLSDAVNKINREREE